ncbi:MAG: hypothetical protein HC785_14625 [Calothrix sp. CSU_2_0]|nr:hypothetical protein [Calothrix sp. CSU_2_0]
MRRTKAYSEEEEYELVYGADWCLVAKELDIEKLWVWVFDMSDEEAAIAKEEMQQLLEMKESQPSQTNVETNTKEQELIQPLIQQLNRLSQQVTVLSNKIDLVSASIKEFSINEKKQEFSDAIINQIITNAVKQAVDEAINKMSEASPKPNSIIDSQQKQYHVMTKKELQEKAAEKNIKGRSSMNKNELITALTKSDR